MDEHVVYVGLDVHKETISVALADGGKRGEVREHGQIANTPAALTRLLGKLATPGAVLRLCYEAGPCGYGIQRHLSAAGHECVVVAPSLSQRETRLHRELQCRSPMGLNQWRLIGSLRDELLLWSGLP